MITRYQYNTGSHEHLPDAHGKWVRYSDYEAYARVTERMLHDAQQRIERLEAMVVHNARVAPATAVILTDGRHPCADS